MPGNARRVFHIADDDAFALSLRWSAPPLIWRQVALVEASAPARLTVPAHGIPDGWFVKVESVGGMREINETGWQRATVLDANVIELNRVNASRFHRYHDGGVVKFLTPVDLQGMTISASLKDRPGEAAFLELTQGAGVTADVGLSAIHVLATLDALREAKRSRFVVDIDAIGADGVNRHVFTGFVSRERT
ncbi:MAG: hypothetical protein LBU11_12325 [Zoogloeaceae bacterium]|jgi:hypothetical protein|nr:hypothetical protein [Zoogloeaceae bacterium]